MILNIPHTSTKIPPKYTNQYLIDITTDINYLTDWYVDELFDFNPTGSEIQPFEYSRLFCDVERLLTNEDMERHGMGICYTKSLTGQIIRVLSNTEKQDIINNYYIPYHVKLANEVRKIIPWYKPFIVDCHSFSKETVGIMDDYKSLPDFCIGIDDKHTPPEIITVIENIINDMDYTVDINYPYSGTIVPKEFEDDIDVRSIMIEINKNLYLTDDFKKNDKFIDIKNVISELLTIISDYEHR